MFDRETALRILTAADCCEAVYEPFDSAGFEAWASRFQCVKTWVRGNAEGMGVVSGNTAYIVFRGTEPGKVKDWMTDLTAAPSPFPRFGNNAFVHRGFEAYTLCMDDDFLRFASKHRGKRLVICGHSLGGSAAVIAAGLIQAQFPFCDVITFGAAPAGNREFVEAFNRIFGDSLLRFEHSTDSVPVLPGLLPWLRHVGRRLYLPTCRKTIWENPPWYKYRADRLLGLAPIAVKTYANPLRLIAVLGGRMLSDHGMAKYSAHLKRALG